MQFDDRLATVLRFRADGAVTRRIQLRQLLDLLGTSPSEARGPALDAAYARLGELAAEVPEAERAAMIEGSALRLRSPRLVAALSNDSPRLAATAVRRAQLSEEEWLDLIPALPVAARGFLRLRRDLGATVCEQLERLGIHDRALPAGEYTDEEAAPPSSPLEGIGAIVRRIEAYRQNKAGGIPQPANDSPLLPLGEEHILHLPRLARALDFETDAAGIVTWCDPGVAPMVSGLSLAPLEPAIARALRLRQPLRAVRVELVAAPAISGAWQIDAAPWFDTAGGRFIGFRGRMRRLEPARAELSPPPAPTDSAPDKLRQVLHELRTPVNAIQGFAEIIQQQLFGPTPHEYRALAAGIASDAARMLAAFEELERLAKLESKALQIEVGECDFAALVSTTIDQLAAHTAPRSSGFALRGDDALPLAAITREEGERIVWRLLATLAGTAAPGEVLRIRLRRRGDSIRLSADLPAALAARGGDSVFEAAVGAIPQVIAAGVFGVGFALRLARAEARSIGGGLTRKADRIRLDLPCLTMPGAGHSDKQIARDAG